MPGATLSLLCPFCVVSYGGPSFLQILLSEHTTVIACARSPENASVLQELKAQHKDRLQLVILDVADTSSIQVRQWMHRVLF